MGLTQAKQITLSLLDGNSNNELWSDLGRLDLADNEENEKFTIVCALLLGGDPPPQRSLVIGAAQNIKTGTAFQALYHLAMATHYFQQKDNINNAVATMIDDTAKRIRTELSKIVYEKK